MRKQTKIAALVSAAALLAIGASLTAVAATPGWDGNGIYRDRDGNPEEGWHRWAAGVGGNDQYYYSDENGETVVNAFVSKNGGLEDTSYPLYYVGPDGTRVHDMWIAIPNDEGIMFGYDEIEVTPTYLYRYMTKNQNAVQSTTGALKKETVPVGTNATVTGSFIFDGDGIMQESTVMYDGGEYYCVTEEDIINNIIEVEKDNVVMSIKDAGYVEGQVVTGWVHMPWDDDQANLDQTESQWRYYDGGKRLMNTTKVLSWAGKKNTYLFQDGLCEVDSGLYDVSKATLSFQYYATASTAGYSTPTVATSSVLTFNSVVTETGGIMGDSTGWASYVNGDGETEWYYIVAIRDGNLKKVRNVVFNGEVGNTYWRSLMIDKKIYLFDETGKMVDGEVDLSEIKNYTADPWCGIRCYDLKNRKNKYFFNNSVNSGHRGEMMTGKVTYYDDNRDDTVTRYYDPTMGLMTNAIIGDYVYDQYGDLYVAMESRDILPLDKAGSFKIYAAVSSGKSLAAKIGDTENAADTYLIIDSRGKALKNKSVVTVDELKFTIDKNYVAKIKTE